MRPAISLAVSLQGIYKHTAPPATLDPDAQLHRSGYTVGEFRVMQQAAESIAAPGTAHYDQALDAIQAVARRHFGFKGMPQALDNVCQNYLDTLRTRPPLWYRRMIEGHFVFGSESIASLENIPEVTGAVVRYERFAPSFRYHAKDLHSDL